MVLVAVAVGVRGWGTIAVREARSSDAREWEWPADRGRRRIREWEREDGSGREATRRRGGKGRRGPGVVDRDVSRGVRVVRGVRRAGGARVEGGENRAARRGPFGVWGIRRTVDQSGGRSGGLRTVRVAVRADAERSRSERAIRLTARHAGADQRVRAEPPSRARGQARARRLRSSERRRRLGRRRDHRARRDHHARAGARTSRRRPKPRGG